VDAPGQLAQLLDGELGLLLRLGHQLGRARGISCDPRLGETEGEGHGDQPLLGAVVEITLDAPALFIGRGEDALPGVAQVIDPSAQRARTLGLAGLAWEADLGHRIWSLPARPIGSVRPCARSGNNEGRGDGRVRRSAWNSMATAALLPLRLAGRALDNVGVTSRIRAATPGDWPAIWGIVREVVVAADTFAYDPQMSEEEARALWMVASPGRTTVAVDGPEVSGTANMYANRAGPGAHVASASFMVASAARGRGVGRALAEDALAWARAAGFRAMQFNAVAETNAAAVALYRSLGFSIVGTVPEGFDHPEHGLVGLHVMHMKLR
jgi:L-amino acid N-acyltransferase YncA